MIKAIMYLGTIQTRRHFALPKKSLWPQEARLNPHLFPKSVPWQQLPGEHLAEMLLVHDNGRNVVYRHHCEIINTIATRARHVRVKAVVLPSGEPSTTSSTLEILTQMVVMAFRKKSKGKISFQESSRFAYEPFICTYVLVCVAVSFPEKARDQNRRQKNGN